ncbi:RsmB/NOP family class I SAM-dependent RNA methyltransferase [Aureimonas fodinaquatilis]|uniref:RsmB/NOP family class I SAM-dependent RNA methyltransferase n=1 Tax=Aureimonas fodinaquatilis TaxID=2565783 RepID=A0A5B0E0G6_9HYPH|nr:RsmB/NOP family class I SAM-dependent RNA methyltransferase [Aureimonas fodinaquatilis]KAA0972128.1 RsmB/NOP family class I SAM-dependent RNA methyltransferase [Aureimonas fodinaquatilis]
MRLGGRIAAAIEVIEDMDRRKRPVADALKDWGLSHRFAGSGDRSAIGNIVYDTLRRRRSLGFRMGQDDTSSVVFGAVLASGLDADALVAALDGDRHAPALPADGSLARFSAISLAEAPAAVQADVPDWLAGPLQDSLGDNWVTEAQAFSERPPLDMRVNTLKAAREDVLAELAPFDATPCEISPVGLRIAPIASDGRHPNVQVERGFQTGAFEIQDEGSQLAALLSGAKPGDTVLDACAGAGGKTLALAAMMKGQGVLHAYDTDRQRLAPIWDRLARAGAGNVEVHAPRASLGHLHGTLDLVVADAPCSGAGTWRRRPDAKWRLSAAQLERRVAEQAKVLAMAEAFVRPGGRLVYITCSLLAQENALQVQSFLQQFPEFEAEDAARIWQETLPDSGARYHPSAIGAGCGLTMTPQKTGTDGFFFASLTRRG